MCSVAHLTCNSSLEDDYGWDFLVEIPLASRPTVRPAMYLAHTPPSRSRAYTNTRFPPRIPPGRDYGPQNREPITMFGKARPARLTPGTR